MSQPDNQWWYATGGQRFGPYSARELKRMANAGEIVCTTLVWKKGLAEWVQASSIKGLIPESSVVEPPPLPSIYSNQEQPNQSISNAQRINECDSSLEANTNSQKSVISSDTNPLAIADTQRSESNSLDNDDEYLSSSSSAIKFKNPTDLQEKQNTEPTLLFVTCKKCGQKFYKSDKCPFCGEKVTSLKTLYIGVSVLLFFVVFGVTNHPDNNNATITNTSEPSLTQPVTQPLDSKQTALPQIGIVGEWLCKRPSEIRPYITVFQFFPNGQFNEVVNDPGSPTPMKLTGKYSLDEFILTLDYGDVVTTWMAITADQKSVNDTPTSSMGIQNPRGGESTFSTCTRTATKIQ